MADQPEIERAVLHVGGLSLHVVEVHGTEAISTLFRYEVFASLDGAPPDPQSVVGAEASLTFQTRFGDRRSIQAIVAEAEVRASDLGRGDLRVVLRPLAHAQSIGRDCRAFQDTSVPDAVKTLLADYQGPIRWSLKRAYAKSPYRAQYREDDWTFASRLMEEEGIYYWFDHDDGSELVFDDDSTAAPPLRDVSVLRFVLERELYDDADVVKELGTVVRATTQKFTVGSFDPDRPNLKVSGAVGGGRHELYDAPGGGPTDPAVCTSRAKTKEEAAKGARHRATGHSNCVRLYPGRSFEIVGHPLSRFDGQFLVVSTEVHLAEGVPFSCTFVAQPLGASFRPEAVTPEAKQAGLQLGVVGGPDGAEVHPDDKGRVRAQLHWDRVGKRDEASGTWMRIAQRATPGSMLLPRMGWNVATFNEEGAVDAPSILCRIHDAKHPPAYDLPANKTRVVYKTATTPAAGSFNEVRFEDLAGSEEMLLLASRDMNVKVLHVKSQTVGNEHARKVGSNHDMTVLTDHLEKVNGNQSTKIGADQELLVGGARSKQVGGTDTTQIGGSRTLKAGKGLNLTVTKNRTLKAPIVLDTTLGTLTTSAKDLVTLVGGVEVKATAQSITEDVQKVSAQVIGGAKVELSGKTRGLDVSKSLREAVGGAVIVKTNGTFTESAEKQNQYVVGLELEGTSKEVFAEAQKTIRVKCGDSVLTLTEKEITLVAPKLDLAGAHIDADTARIERN